MASRRCSTSSLVSTISCSGIESDSTLRANHLRIWGRCIRSASTPCGQTGSARLESSPLYHASVCESVQAWALPFVHLTKGKKACRPKQSRYARSRNCLENTLPYRTCYLLLATFRLIRKNQTVLPP